MRNDKKPPCYLWHWPFNERGHRERVPRCENGEGPRQPRHGGCLSCPKYRGTYLPSTERAFEGRKQNGDAPRHHAHCTVRLTHGTVSVNLPAQTFSACHLSPSSALPFPFCASPRFLVRSPSSPAPPAPPPRRRETHCFQGNGFYRNQWPDLVLSRSLPLPTNPPPFSGLPPQRHECVLVCVWSVPFPAYYVVTG